MSSICRDSTTFKHDYIISICDSPESVRYHNDSSALCKFIKSICYKFLVFRIGICSGFIKNYYRRIFQYCSCNGYALTLASGKLSSKHANFSIIAMRKFCNKVVAGSSFCRSYHFIHCCVFFSHAKIISNRPPEKEIILRNIGCHTHKRIKSIFTNVTSADGYASIRNVPIMNGKSCCSGFSTARFTNKSRFFPLLCFKAHIFKDIPVLAWSLTVFPVRSSPAEDSST